MGNKRPEPRLNKTTNLKAVGPTDGEEEQFILLIKHAHNYADLNSTRPIDKHMYNKLTGYSLVSKRQILTSALASLDHSGMM